MSSANSTDSSSELMMLEIAAKELTNLAGVGKPAANHLNGTARSLMETVQNLEILYVDRQEYLDALELGGFLSQFSSDLECIVKRVGKVFNASPIRSGEADEIKEELSRMDLDLGKCYKRMLASSSPSAELRARQAATKCRVAVAHMNVQELKVSMREAVKNLAVCRPLFRNPAVDALLPRNFERLRSDPHFGTISGLADYIKSWEGRPSLRTDTFFLYYNSDGTPNQVRDKPPLMTSLSIGVEDHVITGKYDENSNVYTLQGQRVGMRAFWTTSSSEQYEAIFTPWGLVGRWKAQSSGAWHGPFYMWIADGPQAHDLLKFAQSLL